MFLSVVSEPYRMGLCEDKLREWRRDGYVVLPDFFTDEVNGWFRRSFEEMSPLITQLDFVMKEFDTPRKMGSIGGEKIRRNALPYLFLYGHREVIRMLEQVTGGAVHPCTNLYQWCVYNVFRGKEATQGWHLDDPSYVLITVLEENLSQERVGGCIEYIAGWNELVRERGLHPVADLHALVEIAEREHLIKTIYLKTNETCLLGATNWLHRVAPMPKEASSRVTSIFSYQDREQVDYYDDGKKVYG